MALGLGLAVKSGVHLGVGGGSLSFSGDQVAGSGNGLSLLGGGMMSNPMSDSSWQSGVYFYLVSADFRNTEEQGSFLKDENLSAQTSKFLLTTGYNFFPWWYWGISVGYGSVDVEGKENKRVWGTNSLGFLVSFDIFQSINLAFILDYVLPIEERTNEQEKTVNSHSLALIISYVLSEDNL